MIPDKSTSTIRTLLKNGATESINFKNIEGNTALHETINKYFYNIIKLLVDYKANLTIQNNTGQTPLDFVIIKLESLKSFNIFIVTFLIESIYIITNNNTVIPSYAYPIKPI